MSDKLHEWGWDSRWEALFQEAGVEGCLPARVTLAHRDRWVLQTSEGPEAARIAGSGFGGPTPSTGDWVVTSPGPYPSDPWTIEGVLSRKSAVKRGTAGDGTSEQVLAANVDRLWIVQGLDGAPNLRSLERYLAVGWESGASPEVVLTKSDLAERLDESISAVGRAAVGVPLWVVSASDDAALGELRGSLEPGSTVALIGPSGAGKSTLINLLAGADLTRTGAVREGDGKGRHTTTSRELIRIHNGALFLDTPGLRELRVLTLDDGLGQAFPEIEALAPDCKFRDCLHASEPGCAVVQAVETGHLSADRLVSFRKLQAEAAYERRKVDPRAMAEAVSEYKTAMRTVKAHPKHRGRK